jgi:hypothetical protein
MESLQFGSAMIVLCSDTGSFQHDFVAFCTAPYRKLTGGLNPLYSIAIHNSFVNLQ